MKDKFKDVNITASPIDTPENRIRVSNEYRLIQCVLPDALKREEIVFGGLPLRDWSLRLAVVPRCEIEKLPKEELSAPKPLSHRGQYDRRLRQMMVALEFYLKHNPQLLLDPESGRADFPAITLHLTESKNRVYIDGPKAVIRVDLKPPHGPYLQRGGYRMVSLKNLHQLTKGLDVAVRADTIRDIVKNIETTPILIKGKPQSGLVDGVELWRTVAPKDTWSAEDGEFGFRALSEEALDRLVRVLSEDEIEDWYKAVETIALG